MNLQLTEFERYLVYDPDSDLFLTQNYARWVADVSKAGKWVREPSGVKQTMKWRGLQVPANLSLVKYYFASKPMDTTPIV